MKNNPNYSKAILAIKRAVCATFDVEKWLELGFLTDTTSIITDHPRLLRSFHFGDEDYDACVLDILPKIINNNNKNLQIIEEYVELEQWLRNNDTNLYKELYETGELVSLQDVENAANRFDMNELNKHATRIRHGIREDPEQAIGSAKELLETTLKAVLKIEGSRSTDDILVLLKKAQIELGVNPIVDGERIPGSETIKRVINSLGQIVVGVAEVRNLYGTGHGRHKSIELEAAHARLVVNSAITIATFLLEIAMMKETIDGIDKPI